MIRKSLHARGFAVGKTSLVSRFVHSIFSDRHLTTIGVKIDKKSVSLLRGEMELILWDIYRGRIPESAHVVLQGRVGALLVADGTGARRSMWPPRCSGPASRDGKGAVRAGAQ